MATKTKFGDGECGIGLVANELRGIRSGEKDPSPPLKRPSLLLQRIALLREVRLHLVQELLQDNKTPYIVSSVQETCTVLCQRRWQADQLRKNVSSEAVCCALVASRAELCAPGDCWTSHGKRVLRFKENRLPKNRCRVKKRRMVHYCTSGTGVAWWP